MQKTIPSAFTSVIIALSVFAGSTQISENSAFAQIDDLKFYGKGKVDESSPFAGEIVHTLVNGETGLVMHSTPKGIVIVRLAVSESDACILTISTVCLDATVTDVVNTDTHDVGDMIKLTIDLENKKEFVSVISGPLEGANITIDLLKTRTQDSGEFSLSFAREGGIAGIQRIVTVDSANKTMTVKNGPDQPEPFMLSDGEIAKIKKLVLKSNFFDLAPKEYPPAEGSADYFAYAFDITTSHFSSSIQWTDTSDIPASVSKKIHLLQEGLESIILVFLEEHSLEILPVQIAREFALSSPTFAFDGMEETLQARLNGVLESYPPQYIVHVTFDSRHGGYGDRTGQIVTQAITPHLMVITVSDGRVVSAVTDGVFDELTQSMIN